MPYIDKLVDELGKVKAKIADLEKKETAIKEILIKSNETKIVGSLFQATISRSERVTLDMDKVKEFLKADQIKKCERVTPCVSVRVSAKTGK